MPLGQMRQIVTSDQTLTQLQSSLNDQFAAIKAVAIVDGLRLTGISLVTATVNNIPHKLGRKAIGYFITSASAGALIWNDAFTDSVIPLHTSANITVDLWVF